MPPEENLYDDSPDQPESQKPEAKSDEGMKTSILPKDFFSGKDLKPGDKCDIEIVAIHDNDIEVKGCGSSDEGKEKEEQPEESPEQPSSPEGGMSSMME